MAEKDGPSRDQDVLIEAKGKSMAFRIPLDQVPKDRISTHIWTQTVQRELPKELEKIDLSKIVCKEDKGRILDEITNRILDSINVELLAHCSYGNDECLATFYSAKVYRKVKAAFDALPKPQPNANAEPLTNGKSLHSHKCCIL